MISYITSLSVCQSSLRYPVIHLCVFPTWICLENAQYIYIYKNRALHLNGYQQKPKIQKLKPMTMEKTMKKKAQDVFQRATHCSLQRKYRILCHPCVSHQLWLHFIQKKKAWSFFSLKKKSCFFYRITVKLPFKQNNWTLSEYFGLCKL